jgi:hypothetical protein
MTKEQLIGMISEGYNLNQIAAIHMINKERLQEILDAGACAPIIKKGMSKSIPVQTTKEFNKESETLFPNEPGL